MCAMCFHTPRCYFRYHCGCDWIKNPCGLPKGSHFQKRNVYKHAAPPAPSPCFDCDFLLLLVNSQKAAPRASYDDERAFRISTFQILIAHAAPLPGPFNCYIYKTKNKYIYKKVPIADREHTKHFTVSEHLHRHPWRGLIFPRNEKSSCYQAVHVMRKI